MKIGDYQIDIAFPGFILVIIYLAMLIITIIAVIKIIQKAGYSGWWVLLLILPIINVGAIWYFGFARWPTRIRNRNED